MLLVIHNLPKKMTYEGVKYLIWSRCNLKDIIVDNLVMESTFTRKVTIGLTDESDAAIVFKELDGLLLDGRNLRVEDLRKKKDSRYKPLMSHDNDVKYTPFRPTPDDAYSLNGRGNMQKINIPYRGVPSPFDDNPRRTGGSAAPDFIPLNSRNNKYDGGKNDRYFNWKDPNQRPTPDVSGGPSYSNGNFADRNRNRPVEYPRHSVSDIGGGSSLRDPYRRDNVAGRSRNDEVPRPPRFDDTLSRQYDKRLRRDDSYDRPAKRPKVSHFEKPVARNDFGSGHSSSYRGTHVERSDVPESVYYNRTEPKHLINNAPKKAPYSRSQDHKLPRSATNVRGQPLRQPQSFPPPKVYEVDSPDAIKNKHRTWLHQAVSAIVKELFSKNSMYEFVKKQWLLNYIKPVIRSRIDQMLGNRVAVPLQQIIDEYKKKNPPRAQAVFLIQERKKYERMKFDSTLTTKEQYEATVSKLNAQLAAAKSLDTKPFNLLKKQRNATLAPKPLKTPLPAHVLPHPNYSSKLNAQLTAAKSLDTKPFNLLKKQRNAKLAPKPLKTPLPAYVLPHPNYKLKPFKKIEQGVYDHKLDPKLKSALDKELEILCDMFREECQKAEDEDEKNVAARILDTIDYFRQQVNNNVSKRLLNITKNLPLLAFTEQWVNSREVREQLKSLGIASFRKCLGKNKYVATCRTFEQYDHFCAQSTFVINGQTIVFRPLHSNRPSRERKQKEDERAEADDNQNDIDKENDDVVEGEEFDDEDLELYEDDEFGEEDDQNDEKTDAINDDESKIDEVISDSGLESKDGAESGSITKADEAKLEAADDNQTDEAKEPVEIEVKIEQVVNELDHAETAKLYNDITTLSNIIRNEGSVAIAEVNENIPNIDQDDLEDF